MKHVFRLRGGALYAEQCNNKCNNWEQRVWKVSRESDYKTSINEFKKDLIQKGPLFVDNLDSSHAMLAIGYDDSTNSDCLTIYVKNSWGTSWGDGGFGDICVDKNQFNEWIGYFYLEGEIVPPQGVYPIISCVDKDMDGFCNWGITENKPSTCPLSCKSVKDWDDLDPSVGSMDKIPPARPTGLIVN